MRSSEYQPSRRPTISGRRVRTAHADSYSWVVDAVNSHIHACALRTLRLLHCRLYGDDANGNRLSHQIGATTHAYTYAANSNKLTAIAELRGLLSEFARCWIRQTRVRQGLTEVWLKGPASVLADCSSA